MVEQMATKTLSPRMAAEIQKQPPGSVPRYTLLGGHERQYTPPVAGIAHYAKSLKETTRRMAERYGVEINEGEYGALCNKVRQALNGGITGPVLYRITTERVIVPLSYKAMELLLMWHRRRALIMTALPQGAKDAVLMRRYAEKK